MKSTQEKSGDEDNFSLLDWIVLIALTILIAYYVYSVIKERVNYQFDVSLKELRVNISRIISLCESDADCGLSGYVGSPYCYGDSIMRDYLNVSCKNPGRKNARCENRTEFVKINSCRREDEVCSEGECLKISCTNGVWDLGEIGVDCGGFCKSCVGNKTPITPKPKKCIQPDDLVYQKILEVSISKSPNESVNVDWFRVTYGKPSPPYGEYEGFMVAAINTYGTLVCGEYLPLRTNQSVIIDIPFREKIEKFAVTHDNEITDEKEVVGCNQNGICEPRLGETYLGCVTDCKRP